jgi:hypothetical protein
MRSQFEFHRVVSVFDAHVDELPSSSEMRRRLKRGILIRSPITEALYVAVYSAGLLKPPRGSDDQ